MLRVNVTCHYTIEVEEQVRECPCPTTLTCPPSPALADP